uniref:Putative secreted protein n=1 Tax=Ixodes ricinus TaxID=34613 RepID=A0A147BBP9_IXORI
MDPRRQRRHRTCSPCMGLLLCPGVAAKKPAGSAAKNLFYGIGYYKPEQLNLSRVKTLAGGMNSPFASVLRHAIKPISNVESFFRSSTHRKKNKLRDASFVYAIQEAANLVSACCHSQKQRSFL